MKHLLFLELAHRRGTTLLTSGSTRAEEKRLRTVLLRARRRAVFAALEPEGLHTLRGGLGEVLRAVQALHDLVHVVVAGLHRLAFQGKLILQILHHPQRGLLASIKCQHKKTNQIPC